MHVPQHWRRILVWIGREVAGLMLLVAVVLMLATMPPLQVYGSGYDVMPAYGSPGIGYIVMEDPRADVKELKRFSVAVDTSRWGKNILAYWEIVKTGTLGKDRLGRSVSQVVGRSLRNSLLLVAIALTLAVLLGVVKGIFDFRSLRRKRAALGPAVTSLVQGFPDFWLVLVLQLAVVWLWETFRFRPFPVAWISSAYWASMVYPVIVLALVPWAYVARITSTALNAVWELDYMRAARARGLTEWRVLLKHGVISSLVPILDGLPNALAVLFSTLLMVETLFNVPGISVTMREAVTERTRWPPLPPGAFETDVPVVVAAGVALTLLFWLFYLLIRFLRQVADPRLKGSDLS